MFAVVELVVVLVGNQQRPLLNELNALDVVAQETRQRDRLDLSELIEREASRLVLAVLVVESIAVLQVIELLGNNAFKKKYNKKLEISY